eukprot:CAMPEP_0117443300 /NCGR_PEP_ID=MMETSP0759-20121206/4620_1 /TAXON_ID=63605 /ORGANISM="Percolomonas cosmopolitus, Strain WS" /LENGTH=1098 /DNA_ID=CAMNT_0005235263 /DNA_START=1028 /DNA_END=4321 /DNA_ORIENTATION=+
MTSVTTNVTPETLVADEKSLGLHSLSTSREKGLISAQYADSPLKMTTKEHTKSSPEEDLLIQEMAENDAMHLVERDSLSPSQADYDIPIIASGNTPNMGGSASPCMSTNTKSGSADDEDYAAEDTIESYLERQRRKSSSGRHHPVGEEKEDEPAPSHVEPSSASYVPSRPHRKRKSMGSASSPHSIGTTPNSSPKSARNRKRLSIPAIIGNLTKKHSPSDSRSKYLVQNIEEDSNSELSHSDSARSFSRQHKGSSHSLASHNSGSGRSIGRRRGSSQKSLLKAAQSESSLHGLSTGGDFPSHEPTSTTGKTAAQKYLDSMTVARQVTSPLMVPPPKLKRSLTIDTSVGFAKNSVFSLHNKKSKSSSNIRIQESPTDDDSRVEGEMEEEEVLLPLPSRIKAENEDEEYTTEFLPAPAHTSSDTRLHSTPSTEIIDISSPGDLHSLDNGRARSTSTVSSESRRPKLTLHVPPRPHQFIEISKEYEDEHQQDLTKDLQHSQLIVDAKEEEEQRKAQSSQPTALHAPITFTPDDGDNYAASLRQNSENKDLPLYSPLSPFHYPDEYSDSKMMHTFPVSDGTPQDNLSVNTFPHQKRPVVDVRHASKLHTPTPTNEEAESSNSHMQISLAPLRKKLSQELSTSTQRNPARPGLTIVSGRHKANAIKLPINATEGSQDRGRSPFKARGSNVATQSTDNGSMKSGSSAASPASTPPATQSLWGARVKRHSPSSLYFNRGGRSKHSHTPKSVHSAASGAEDSSGCLPCSFITKPIRNFINRYIFRKRKQHIIRDIEMVRSLSKADVMSTCSSVSLARTPSVDGLVAYKKYKSTGSEYAHKRVCQEEYIHRKMHHPNIVRLIGKGGDDQENALVFEFIDGDNLQAYIQNNYPISLLEIRRIIYELLSAIHYIHRKGYVHGDLKSSNILLQIPENRVKVCDFGASAYIGNKSHVELDSGKLMMGTPLYSAPESIFADKEGKYKMSYASDIYQIGLILYELVSGRTPHHDIAGDSFSIFDVIMKLRRKYENGHMLEITPKMCSDEQIVDFFNKCIGIDFKKRPSARELRKHALFAQLRHHVGDGNGDDQEKKFLRPFSRMSSVSSFASS